MPTWASCSLSRAGVQGEGVHGPQRLWKLWVQPVAFRVSGGAEVRHRGQCRVDTPERESQESLRICDTSFSHSS